MHHRPREQQVLRPGPWGLPPPEVKAPGYNLLNFSLRKCVIPVQYRSVTALVLSLQHKARFQSLHPWFICLDNRSPYSPLPQTLPVTSKRVKLGLRSTICGSWGKPWLR